MCTTFFVVILSLFIVLQVNISISNFVSVACRSFDNDQKGFLGKEKVALLLESSEALLTKSSNMQDDSCSTVSFCAELSTRESLGYAEFLTSYLLHDFKYSSFSEESQHENWGASLDSVPSMISVYFSIPAVKQIFQKFSNTEIKKFRMKDGETLLHVAIGCGNIAAIRELVGIGMTFTICDHHGNLPIHYLGRWSENIVHVTVVLVELNADLSVRNQQRRNVAHLLPFALSTAELFGDWVKVVVTLRMGLIFNMRDSALETPMHYAVEYLEVGDETFDQLIHVDGFDINARDPQNRTYLHWAVRNGRGMKTITSIIDHGCDWKIRTTKSWNVLHYAVYGSNVEALDYFLKLGCDATFKDDFGDTPLHKIEWAFMNHIELTSLLLNYGASIYTKGWKGLTVAHRFSEGIRRNKSRLGQYIAWYDYMLSQGFSRLFEIPDAEGKLPFRDLPSCN